MSGQFRENWKRLAGHILPKGPTAVDPQDMVRVEDLTALVTIGTGIPFWRVTNVESDSPYHVQLESDLVVILVSGDYDIILPLDPPVGKRYEIKDGIGDGCDPSTIKRIVPTGTNTIEDIFTEFEIFNCYMSWSLIFAGSGIWRLV